MTPYRLRLVEDQVRPDALLELGPTVRVLYGMAGTLELDLGGSAELVAAGEARFADGEVRIRASVEEAVLWRFELCSVAAAAIDPSSNVKLAATIKLDPAAEHLFCCDRVELRPGTVTPKHTHAGPGIRCVLTGDVRAEIGGERSFHGVGDAWFERGPDPVVGRMSTQGATSFIRALILPAFLRGKTSYRAWDEHAAAQPLPAEYRVMVDQPFSLRKHRPDI